ncbi:ABC transporter permease subunit [Vibrio sp. PID23_8]|uniref:ABC transporter permease subunit n=1 Tax=Vibrio sp. PID23_8 TaxID=1583767 RepID=UPI001C71D3C0|nr:ABC transporter permease subunit [Vibrio sp. PID23_8]
MSEAVINHERLEHSEAKGEHTSEAAGEPQANVAQQSEMHSTPPFYRLVQWVKNKTQTPGSYYGEPGQGNSRVISVISTLFFIGLWAVVTELGLVKPLFLPSPNAVLERFVDLFVNGFSGVSLEAHLLASLGRVFGAFALAVVTAVPIGILIGSNVWVRGVFDPLIEFYRPLPPLAYLPLVIIWLGIDETSKVTLIYLAMFAPITLGARAGVASAKSEQIQAAYSMGASKGQVLYHVIIKSALPEILTGLRIGIGFGWTTLVASEMVAAEAGIGYMVLNAAEFLVTDVVIAGIIIIGLIAYSFDLLMRYLEKKLVPWKGY